MMKASTIRLFALAFVLVIPIAACDTGADKAKPVIDTTSQPKVPSPDAAAAPVTPKAP
jgi:uncharacterized lipoprotein